MIDFLYFKTCVFLWCSKVWWSFRWVCFFLSSYIYWIYKYVFTIWIIYRDSIRYYCDLMLLLIHDWVIHVCATTTKEFWAAVQTVYEPTTCTSARVQKFWLVFVRGFFFVQMLASPFPIHLTTCVYKLNEWMTGKPNKTNECRFVVVERGWIIMEEENVHQIFTQILAANRSIGSTTRVHIQNEVEQSAPWPKRLLHHVINILQINHGMQWMRLCSAVLGEV